LVTAERATGRGAAGMVPSGLTASLCVPLLRRTACAYSASTLPSSAAMVSTLMSDRNRSRTFPVRVLAETAWMPSCAPSRDSRHFLRASEPYSPGTLYRALPLTAVCIARITAALLLAIGVDRPGYLVLSCVCVPGSSILDAVDSSDDGCDAAEAVVVPDEVLGNMAARISFTPPTTPTRISVTALTA